MDTDWLLLVPRLQLLALVHLSRVLRVLRLVRLARLPQVPQVLELEPVPVGRSQRLQAR
jgi:hypothetical protein